MNLSIIISNESYTEEVLRTSIEEARDKQIDELKLHLNYQPQIIFNIASYGHSLQNLIILNLAYNKIVSLEHLQSIGLYQLKQLHLFHNYIATLKSLRKCTLPKLRFLSLVGNKLKSLRHIQELNVPQLQSLMLYDNDISWPVQLIRTNMDHLKNVVLGEEHEDAVGLIYWSRFKMMLL